LNLSLSEFEWVSDLTTAREIWVKVQSYHEGTTHVETRFSERYKHEYENFAQLDGEYRFNVFSLSVDYEQDVGK
jgi:hypothetical protein